MRKQVRAAMIFNGSTPAQIDEIDEETFSEICVMYGDGILGNKGFYDSITPITTAVFNYMRDPNKSPPFDSKKLFPWIFEYEQNPDFEPTRQDAASNALLAFMTVAPGFDIGRFNNDGSGAISS